MIFSSLLLMPSYAMSLKKKVGAKCIFDETVSFRCKISVSAGKY